jgi:hypothetical protein
MVFAFAEQLAVTLKAPKMGCREVAVHGRDGIAKDSPQLPATRADDEDGGAIAPAFVGVLELGTEDVGADVGADGHLRGE